jgi:hypothetical protein
MRVDVAEPATMLSSSLIWRCTMAVRRRSCSPALVPCDLPYTNSKFSALVYLQYEVSILRAFEHLLPVRGDSCWPPRGDTASCCTCGKAMSARSARGVPPWASSLHAPNQLPPHRAGTTQEHTHEASRGRGASKLTWKRRGETGRQRIPRWGYQSCPSCCHRW